MKKLFLAHFKWHKRKANAVLRSISVVSLKRRHSKRRKCKQDKAAAAFEKARTCAYVTPRKRKANAVVRSISVVSLKNKPPLYIV